ncbi:MAG TPA: hypothetical protein VJ783_01535 [Pirellulales bacterium]|nr:hypothetical protein [Pirellulales bacterium]
MSTASYLDRFFEPMTEAFTPELARMILEYRAVVIISMIQAKARRFLAPRSA